MPTSARQQQSAGLLLFRRTDAGVDVLLGHPGGPFWSKRDTGAWTIPKGLLLPGEDPLAAALREFTEETGYTPNGLPHSLGSAQQPGGKLVHAWALEDDWDCSQLRSNTFAMQWPPKSGRLQTFPELDRAAWFEITSAHRPILKGQAVFLDRLARMLA